VRLKGRGMMGGGGVDQLGKVAWEKGPEKKYFQLTSKKGRPESPAMIGERPSKGKLSQGIPRTGDKQGLGFRGRG